MLLFRHAVEHHIPFTEEEADIVPYSCSEMDLWSPDRWKILKKRRWEKKQGAHATYRIMLPWWWEPGPRSVWYDPGPGLCDGIPDPGLCDGILDPGLCDGIPDPGLCGGQPWPRSVLWDPGPRSVWWDPGPRSGSWIWLPKNTSRSFLNPPSLSLSTNLMHHSVSLPLVTENSPLSPWGTPFQEAKNICQW